MTLSELQTADVDRRVMLRWFQQMQLIRQVEERLSSASLAGDLPGPVHVSIGQEAIAVGVCAALRPDDWLASTHRGHGHFLARGGDPKALVAEVFGRVTGACRGRGGSMHVADLSKGILGAQGIVGAGIGLATGAALTERIRRKGAVAVAFFGDGGANQGVLLEALNLAAVWKLPLILVCENNGWSEFTATATLTAGSIADRAVPFGVPSASIDGNSVESVYAFTLEAVDRARRGEGATLLEMRTYRTHGHVETEKSFLATAYRTEAEVDEWRARYSIEALSSRLTSLGVTEAARSKVIADVEREVDAAFTFALESPFPEAEEAEAGAYATSLV